MILIYRGFSVDWLNYEAHDNALVENRFCSLHPFYTVTGRSVFANGPEFQVEQNGGGSDI